MSEHGRANALIRETSPYLLQHAHNPVDWHPWSDEALRSARDGDRPILLSIGYSACHWCHVMERESFENEAIARLMNENFVNIKVDREERPDLDAIYMNAVQMMTGHGGWPMTVFLTPDGMPFYGGTYFPPEDRHGMPGFRRVLTSVAAAWRERRDEIRGGAAGIVEELGKSQLAGVKPAELKPDLLDDAVRSLLASHDSQYGGFGHAPKFPPSMSLSFLLRSHRRTGDQAALDAVRQTLERMAAGGIYDQLGGGFHRYSVDRYWLVPHFEKMLYDNALLARIYLDAHLATGEPLYRRVTEETLDYVVREMTSPEGGFYSSQDADSEGQEGKFFVWTRAEVTAVLGDSEGDLFCRQFDVTDRGNFEGRNILHQPHPARALARLAGMSEAALGDILERGRRRLLEERERRVKPGRDEKILTAWNGLMLRSMAEAARGLGRDDYRRSASRNADFVLSRLVKDGRLLRSFTKGQARFNAYLEDYACLADGLLSLYETTFENAWFDAALRLGERILELFSDPAGGGFFFTSGDHEILIQRPKDFYDNATPSGNSVTAEVFLKLWKLTGDDRWRSHALSIAEALAGPVSRHAAAFSHLLCAMDFALAEPLEIAVAGDPSDPRTLALLGEIRRRYLPNKVVACGRDGGIPLLEGRQAIGGEPAAYVCRNYVCGTPIVSPELLRSQLEGV